MDDSAEREVGPPASTPIVDDPDADDEVSRLQDDLAVANDCGPDSEEDEPPGAPSG